MLRHVLGALLMCIASVSVASTVTVQLTITKPELAVRPLGGEPTYVYPDWMTVIASGDSGGIYSFPHTPAPGSFAIASPIAFTIPGLGTIVTGKDSNSHVYNQSDTTLPPDSHFGFNAYSTPGPGNSGIYLTGAKLHNYGFGHSIAARPVTASTSIDLPVSGWINLGVLADGTTVGLRLSQQEAVLHIDVVDDAWGAQPGEVHGCSGFVEGVSFSPTAPDVYNDIVVSFRPEKTSPIPPGFRIHAVEGRYSGRSIELVLTGEETTDVGREPECASARLSPAFTGSVPIRVHARVGTLPSQLVSSGSIPIAPAEYAGPALLAFRPMAPTNKDMTTIVVPAHGCYHSGRAYAPTTKVSIRAGSIVIDADQEGPTCFAAGDPVTPYEFPIPVGVLEAGWYEVRYRLSWKGLREPQIDIIRSLHVEHQADIANGPIDMAVEYKHTEFGHYFLSAIPAETASLDGGAFGGVWKRTGLLVPVLPVGAGTADTCRFFNSSFAPRSSHFYTPHTAECDKVRTTMPDWLYEGLVFGLHMPRSNRTCAPGTSGLYRLYNSGQGGAPNHRYVTSPVLSQSMQAEHWLPEGVDGYGLLACVPLPR